MTHSSIAFIMIRYHDMILNHLFLHLMLCHIIKIAYLACMILL
uniref:Uncharacterized protein n=1 Tax=Triticum urartu TaxID=4572 RepID=A0A8R7TG41_TRIUA